MIRSTPASRRRGYRSGCLYNHLRAACLNRQPVFFKLFYHMGIISVLKSLAAQMIAGTFHDTPVIT